MKTVFLILLSLGFIFQVALLFADPPQSINYSNGMGVRCTAVEGDYIWIGTSGGLVKMNRFTEEKTFYNALNSGLPDNLVLCISIDTQGVKWIGTILGLVRFDGVSWSVFDPTNTPMVKPQVYAIAIDAQGAKWLGSDECITKYDGVNWTVYNSSATHLQYNTVTGIAIDSQGVKWIGTAPIYGGGASGLVSLNGSTWNSYTTENSGIGGNAISSLKVDGSGKVWICHPLQTDANAEIIGKGLTSFDGMNWTVYTNENSGLPDDNVNCITFAATGMKWIGTNNGLSSFDGTNWIIYNAPASINEQNSFYSISIDTQGNKWLGSNEWFEGAGLIKLNGNNWSVINPSNSGMPTNSVNCMAIDSANTKWMGTYKGLVSFDGLGWDIYTPNNSAIPYGNINCMAFDAQGVLWLGIGSKLVSFSNGNWFTELEYISDLTSIAIDSQNVKWIGIDHEYFGGLLRYNGFNIFIYNEENSGLPGRQVKQVACDALGMLWVASRNEFEANGLTRFDGNNWTIYNSSNSLLPGNDINCIAVDSLNYVWVGTDNGMARFNGSTWTVYNSSNSALPHNIVKAIGIDASGVKWISSGRYDATINSISSKLVRLAGNSWTVFPSAIPKGRSFDLISIDSFGNKWMASQSDIIGLIMYYEGVVQNEDSYIQTPADRFMLGNYPNPFASQTNITFKLEKAGQVELNIYNIKGQLVKTLCHEVLSKGQQELVWDGTDKQNRTAAKGLYLCSLNTRDGSSTRKLIKLK